MPKASPCENRTARDFLRAASALARRLGLAAVIACCWTGYAAAADVPPIKIAVFPFELEDFSAAAAEGSSPDVTAALAQSTEEAKQQLLQSGRYSLIDTAGADLGAAKGQGLRNCGGCEAGIAMKLGADQALIGVVTKISMTEYVVQLQVSDAQKGTVISKFTTDLRMGANDSWFRGVRWLMKNRLLAAN
jgi:opacity protein-like surface antigen